MDSRLALTLCYASKNVDFNHWHLIMHPDETDQEYLNEKFFLLRSDLAGYLCGLDKDKLELFLKTFVSL